MAETTGISWTDHTFNIVWGCVEVSEACDNCYARTLAHSKGYTGAKELPVLWGKDTTRRTLSPHYWNDPLRWNRKAEREGKRRRVFCSSMADVFEDHPTVTQEREKLWPLIKATPWLDWQLLTKRFERMERCLPKDWGTGYPNVWLGLTVERQKWAEIRIPYLLRIPAVVHWLSIEPQIEDITLGRFLEDDFTGDLLKGPCEQHRGVDWVVVGGESGNKARPFKLEWAYNLMDECKAANKAFFFKQTGEVLARQLGLANRAGKEMGEWPEPLRVQQFPQVQLAAIA